MLMGLIEKVLSYLRPDMTEEEVKTKLVELAAGDDEKLNWSGSIVDLLKLLDLDSSLESRKMLAGDLGYDRKYDGSAEDNIWLHKAVLNEIAKRDIKMPAD